MAAGGKIRSKVCDNVSEISKVSAPATFGYTWYHGLPLYCDIIVVKRDIYRKIFVVVFIHIAI